MGRKCKFHASLFLFRVNEKDETVCEDRWEYLSVKFLWSFLDGLLLLIIPWLLVPTMAFLNPHLVDSDGPAL